MASVELPAEWASAAGGRRRLATSGQTVAECLADLVARHPGLAERLAEHHEIFVNWENVRLRQGPASLVASSDVIQIVPTRP